MGRVWRVVVGHHQVDMLRLFTVWVWVCVFLA